MSELCQIEKDTNKEIVVAKGIDKSENFKRALSNLLNIHGIDNNMNIPDYILADYIVDILANYCKLQNRLNKHNNGC